MSDHTNDPFEDELRRIARAMVAEDSSDVDVVANDSAASMSPTDLNVFDLSERRQRPQLDVRNRSVRTPARQRGRVLVGVAAAVLLFAGAFVVSTQRTPADTQVIASGNGADIAARGADVAANAELADLPDVTVAAASQADGDGMTAISLNSGHYAVAVPEAGVPVAAEIAGQPRMRSVPIYDEPGGEPRVLVDKNEIDAISVGYPLLHGGAGETPLVLRVIGESDDREWLRVQTPARPNMSSAWVKRTDFAIYQTDVRIEIDLAGDGSIEIVDQSGVLHQGPIVQGRDGRKTTTGVGFIEAALPGSSRSEAYGPLIFSTAMFSEQLGTFGGSGGHPRNFIHGTNQPDLMGERISSGEIRVTNDTLGVMAEVVVPGTPVIFYDSTTGDTAENARSRPYAQADTRSFDQLIVPSDPLHESSLYVNCPVRVGLCIDLSVLESEVKLDIKSDVWNINDLAVAVVAEPQWSPGDPLPLLADPTPRSRAPVEAAPTLFVTAKPNAGVPAPERWPESVAGSRVISVYDEPAGEPRTLVLTDDVDREQYQLPLMHPTAQGEPLVLWVIEGSMGDDWIKVQAPTLPHRQSVWVRSEDFVFGTSNTTIEIDIGEPASLALFENGERIRRVVVAAGRDSRPSVTGESMIASRIDGATLPPAYGPWVLHQNVFSEVLGSFGGGPNGLPPSLAIRGTTAPDTLGMNVSSGGIRVENSVLDLIADHPQGIVGARVVTYESGVVTREQVRGAPWTEAETVGVDSDLEVAVVEVFT